MAQGYERKDNMPKMCFKGIWTKDHHVEDFTPDFCPSVFFCYFWCFFSAGILSRLFLSCLLLFLLAFFFLLVLFLCLHISTFSKVSSILFFWTPELDCSWFLEELFLYLPSVWKVILGQCYERNYQAQKGITSG